MLLLLLMLLGGPYRCICMAAQQWSSSRMIRQYEASSQYVAGIQQLAQRATSEAPPLHQSTPRPAAAALNSHVPSALQ
jgi:hypothetical protein